ncbi:hypothetical protein ElyMa_000091000 [Elysia marginata]|uniref:Interferon-induced transmembrane protein n=1 Tax=Elysia marginata TaxID=1093978 RepID=A0AAV4EJG6_9GAST|nr:hypothetical protein ElyMa_000091000 [Elysia marginata]
MTEASRNDTNFPPNSQSQPTHHLLPGQPFGYGVNDDDKPISDNLKWSLFSIILCPVFGPIATYKSVQCRNYLKDGKRHEASRSAIVSRRFSFSGLVMGIIFWILYFAIYVFNLGAKH